MNREIKFRGKSYFNGRWIFGDLYRTNLDGGMAIQYYDEVDGWMTENIHENTVGQFTGLIDKNGKEIYEGDILAWKSVVCEEDGVEIFFGKVTFTDGVFCVDEDWESSVERVLCDSEEYCIARVIGNIHDNPELMEGGEKCQ